MGAVFSNPIIIGGVVVIAIALAVAVYFGVKLAKSKASKKGTKLK